MRTATAGKVHLRASLFQSSAIGRTIFVGLLVLKAFVDCRAFNVSDVLLFEFVKLHVTGGFFGLSFGFLLLYEFYLVNNVLEAAFSLSLEVSLSQVENYALIYHFFIESVVHVDDILLLLDFFNSFLNLLRESEAIFLLPHLILDHLHVLVSSTLLILFSHSQYFAVPFTDVLYKVSSVSNESPFDGVHNGAGLLVETK